ncbi:MAG TPA: MASE1 domain-containing protein [Actinophytocola sp.]|uniref:MASE1 domain-containing protein n=1 Tax=Actinophytocola sp. TaxID=1872138 RepID=UPI002DDD8F80|nr:MASE1 domain-containing protein [Actinophytocola sp.]HEV2784319.1 MASE1 domain-containing protein [Actinophytocola sp.]
MPAAVSPEQTRRYLVAGLQILFVAVAYYLAARIGLSLALVRDQVTPLWPPTGIALACLLLLGVRCWPGITIGAFFANVAIGPTVPAVVAISAGNTLAPVCAWFLLSRVGFRSDLRRLKDALALIFLGAFAGMLISATIGSGTLVVAEALQPRDFWSAWSVWWTGDAMGVLVVAPVLLVAASVRWTWRVAPRRAVEGASVLVGTLAVTVAVTQTSGHLLFLVFPMLIWAALRFQQVGAVPCNLVVSVTAVLAAAAGDGPFAGVELLPKMVTLQAFNGAVTLTALLLAAIVDERNAAQRSVERAVSQLADAVRMLEPYSLLRNGLLEDVFRKRSMPDQH